MGLGDFRVYVQHDRGWGDHRLFVYRDTGRRGPSGRIVETATDFVWGERHEGDCWTHEDGIGRADPLIQAIMDKAWEVGFRPTGFSDIKNETAAIRAHLEDMKTIAFHQLKIGR